MEIISFNDIYNNMKSRTINDGISALNYLLRDLSVLGYDIDRKDSTLDTTYDDIALHGKEFKIEDIRDNLEYTYNHITKSNINLAVKINFKATLKEIDTKNYEYETEAMHYLLRKMKSLGFNISGKDPVIADFIFEIKRIELNRIRRSDKKFIPHQIRKELEFIYNYIKAFNKTSPIRTIEINEEDIDYIENTKKLTRIWGLTKV